MFRYLKDLYIANKEIFIYFTINFLFIIYGEYKKKQIQKLKIIKENII